MVDANSHTLQTAARRGENPYLVSMARAFNEGIMGFLALVALATALGPLVFDVSPLIDRLLEVIEWTLVVLFATETAIQGALAPNFGQWVRSPWRIIDAVTVLGPVAALLPFVSDAASGSLILRLLRVGRAVALGTRAGSVAVRRPRVRSEAPLSSIPVVSVVSANGNPSPADSDWNSFLAWSREPSPAWFHASNLSRDRFYELAKSAELPEQDISRVFDEDAHARLRSGPKHTMLILQIPTVSQSGFPEVHRARLMAVITKESVFTATTALFDLPSAAADLTHFAALPNATFSTRIACGLLALALERNSTVAQRFDDESRRLEALEGGSAFLRDTFRLRREFTSAGLDLWHLKTIIRALADGKATIGAVNLRDAKYLDDLLAETESLYESVNKGKDEVKSLIELHINFKSFEMNQFLKLLAVVSFLGLIPSVVGGLLGMNVSGNPWSVSLGQVAFGVAMGMATALYVFAVRGWLK